MSLNPNIFREYDIRGLADRDLTDEAVDKIGRAYGTFLRQRGKSRVCVARDGRLSSPRIQKALIGGIRSTGIDVINIGVVTTPLLYFSIVTLERDGGVMVTGSHNPAEFNGLKICLGKDTLHGEEIRELGVMAGRGAFERGEGKLEAHDIIPTYRSYLKERFSFKKKLKVVVDAGNGAASVVAPELFRELGCEVTELFCDLDGTFPNHFPDPTDEKNLRDLMKKVRETGAQIGIAFDGDADRLGVVTEKGELLYGDRVLLLFARHVLAEHPGSPVIGEVKCSRVLFDDIARHGGVPIMWKAGHSLIKAKMRETRALLAGEMSGHFFFADRYFGFDDGVYAALRLLEILDRSSRPLSELLADVPHTYSTPELRFDCPDEKKFDIVKKAVEYFRERYQVIDIDGVRVNFPDGWGLVRASNTQPVLVMRFEADSGARLKEIQDLVVSKIREFSAGKQEFTH
jgi:phosphomannomutase/phosphoglucomutase